MALVTSREMLLKAQKEGYAVGAFNVENMEMVQAVIAAAEELKAPVMLQTTPSTVKYGGLDIYFHMALAAAKSASVPVCMHLDHGNSFELAAKALQSGYTSIMIDGSPLSFEENIELSKRVVAMCSPSGVSVEAELGKVGGKEDDHEATNCYTDPIDAKTFVEQTGVDSLAIAIGTAHGFYEGTPVLDIERLSEIKSAVDIPLVLHGASGLSDEVIAECIKRGICKVNFATELRVAYSEGVKEVLFANPNTIDPKAYGVAGKEKVKQLVMNRMKVCGCDGKK